MVEETNERVKKFSEGVFTTGSRAKAPRENGISSRPSPQDDLLIAVIILGIIVCALILIIIYGYCKYVRRGGKKGTEEEGRDRSKNMREAMKVAAEQPSPSRSIEHQQSEVPQQTVPVKTRKRSMTFSETDEECRKYREGLADSYNNSNDSPEAERSRKKSVVTFVGVKEIDGNDS